MRQYENGVKSAGVDAIFADGGEVGGREVVRTSVDQACKSIFRTRGENLVNLTIVAGKRGTEVPRGWVASMSTRAHFLNTV